MIASSVFVAMGKINFQEWMDYTQVLLGIYVGGKALQGSVSAATGAGDAKKMAREAHEENKKLRAALAANDGTAEEAMDEKFGEEDTDPSTSTSPEGEDDA